MARRRHGAAGAGRSLTADSSSAGAHCSTPARPAGGCGHPAPDGRGRRTGGRLQRSGNGTRARLPAAAACGRLKERPMARMYLTASTEVRWVYAVDQTVGSGCTNRRDDVLLVQFFLKVISEGPEKALFRPPGVTAAMKCDGLWGPTSQAYLNHFIKVSSNLNPNSPLTKDGRVDPVVGGKYTGSLSGKLYTILALNVSYKKARGADALADITTDPVFPADLKPSLKIS
jgi:hypothetical protein